MGLLGVVRIVGTKVRGAGVAISRPFFLFRQSAVAEEIAVVFRGEVIAERSSFFFAILKKDPGTIDHANDEDKGTNEEQGIQEVNHRVLLYNFDASNRQEGARRAAHEIEMDYENGLAGESVQN
jgi:hypothetical protein